MSDREMWPNEQDNRGQWTAPTTGPAAVGDGDETAAVPPQTSNEQASGPSWPSPTAPAQPGQHRPYGSGQDRSYGYGRPPAGHPGDQGYADQSYADPSYGAGPGYAQGQYRQPPSGPAPSYGHRPYGQAPHAQGLHAQGPYGQAPYGQPPYGQPPYAGQPPYGQPPYSQPGQQPYGQPPYGQPPYAGQPPYGEPPYGQPPYGSPGGQRPGGSTGRSRALRSAAAVLVIVAAAVAGGGASQLIWSSAKPAPTATPSVGAPSGNSGNTGPSGGEDPFGSIPGGTGGTGPGANTGEGAGGPSDVSSIAAKVDPALVDVNVIFNYQSMEGAGTGIVLTSNGLVLTNNHVIDEATKISVTDVGNGQTYAANVVGYDSTHDVALIQLQGASGLTRAKLDSTPASVGEAVVAIGNAGGTGGTPTSAGGSVTALGQKITASDELTDRSENLTGLIEVNANVEAGDSGGPLVNADGQVEGMDTAASEGFNFSTQGNQGFAIPITFAMGIARDIESGKGTSTVHVGQTAFLGLLLSPPGESSSTNGAPPDGSPFGGTGGTTVTCAGNPDGLEVNSVVAGAPAQKAGITGCDTITTFNGTKLSSAEDLTKVLVGYHPGQKVTIGWVTSTGQARSASIVLASGPPS